jgi:hypothetical protein
MTPFEQLKLLYKQLFNLSNEIKNLIIKADFDEVASRVQHKDTLIKNIINARNHLDMSEEEKKELKAKENEIAKLEKQNIDTLTQLKGEILEELHHADAQQKINTAYDLNPENQGSIVDFSE